MLLLTSANNSRRARLNAMLVYLRRAHTFSSVSSFVRHQQQSANQRPSFLSLYSGKLSQRLFYEVARPRRLFYEVSLPRNVFFYSEGSPTSLVRTYMIKHWPLEQSARANH